MHHKTAVITGDVQIGESVTIAPYSVITGPVRIGDGAYIGAHAVIGAPAQSGDVWPSPTADDRAGVGVVIDAGACLREFVTVHQGMLRPTFVESDALVMAYCHVSHDTYVGQGVTLSTGATLGGFTSIDAGANLGQHAVTHPWVVIGQGAMVGLNSSVIRDVDPFTKVAGAPARVLGPNTHAMPNGVVPDSADADYAQLVASRDELQAAWRSGR